MTRRPGWVIAVIAVAVVVSAAAGAQPPLPERSAATRPAGFDTSRARLERDAAAIVVPTEPNAVRVVAIPVPEELRGRDLRYELVRLNGFGVLGSVEGAITADGADRPLLISVVVPASARSGRVSVGVMRFTCGPGCEPVGVSIVLDVATRFSLQIDPDRALVGTLSGGRFRALATVRNSGNDDERVEITLRVPTGWRSRLLSPMPLHVGIGLSARFEFEVTVSPETGAGNYGVAIDARSRGGIEATSALSVHVGGRAGSGANQPQITASMASTGARDGTLLNAFGVSLAGEVLTDVRANGQFTMVPDRASFSALTQRSLGRLGFAPNVGFLQLIGPAWTATGGNVSFDNTGVAGIGLSGLGTTVATTTRDWRAHVLAARPGTGRVAVDGRYVYADAARRIGPVWAGLMAADLEDGIPGVRAREARTAAATLSASFGAGGLIDIQAGARATPLDTGVVARVRLGKHTPQWGFGVSAEHSPGGTAAMAGAEDQLVVDGFRRFGRRLSVGVSAWRDRDDARPSEAVQSDGWSASPSLNFGRWGSLSLGAHESSFRGTGVLGTFGNGNRQFDAAWSFSRGALRGRVGASHGRLERTTQVGDDIDLDVSAPRTAAFMSASTFTTRGQLQVDGTFERTGGGVGVPTRQVSLGLRADDVPLVPGWVYGHAEVSSYYLGASGTSLGSQIVGARVQLGSTSNLMIDLERGGFDALGTQGRTPWVASIRIQRAIAVPGLRRATLGGLVFADRNGDGRRNNGEPGLNGAIVRVDGQAVAANEAGRFEIGRGSVSRIEVDPLSLPPGWMAAGRDMDGRPGRVVELPVVPTSPVDVTLRVAPSPGLDAENVHLDRAVIILTDSLGRLWTGAPDTRGLLHFDALPPGAYSVTADLSRVGEVLTLPDTLPTVQVDGSRSTLRVDLLVKPRPVRINPMKGPGGSGGDGKGADGSAGRRDDDE